MQLVKLGIHNTMRAPSQHPNNTRELRNICTGPTLPSLKKKRHVTCHVQHFLLFYYYFFPIAGGRAHRKLQPAVVVATLLLLHTNPLRNLLGVFWRGLQAFLHVFHSGLRINSTVQVLCSCISKQLRFDELHEFYTPCLSRCRELINHFLRLCTNSYPLGVPEVMCHARDFLQSSEVFNDA